MKGSNRWLLHPGDPASSRRLAEELGVTPVTAQVLLNRGYLTPHDARRFLDAPLDALSDPESIVDIPKAVSRLSRAIAGKELITIYGDYDADGVTATSILMRGLGALGGQVEWFVPSRFAEGYGLNSGALERIRAGGSRLVVAVDCGVTATEEVAQAADTGQEIIVVDHHEPGPSLPPALAVIDPKRRDAQPPFREYSAAGLAFQLLRAVRRSLGRLDFPDECVDLAALGTIADVVPLVHDNRIIARAGLRRMFAAPTPGIAALIRVGGIIGEVTARHVGFSLAPRINAAGRLGDAGQAVRLLLTDDPAQADGIAATLDEENRARQQLCEQILTQAIEEVERRRLHDAPAIVLAGSGWHSGVIGIVASQLVERYYRPVVLLAVADGVGKGSARSIAAFHMVEGLTGCADLLTRFGGHAMAAGLTIAADRIPDFAARFTETASGRLQPDDLVPQMAIDAEVNLSDITDLVAHELSAMAPFGAGNPEPLLAARGLQAVSTRVMGDGTHLRMGVTDGETYVEAVGFRLGDASELLAFTRARLDLAFAVSIDRWEDRERLQLMVRDLQTPGVDLDAVLTDSRLLVDRLFARAEDYLGDGALGIEEAGGFNTKVVGVTFEGRQEVVRSLSAGDGLHLQREPANPVDPHAIRVLTTDGRQVGFLSARIAARLAPSIDSGARYTAAVSQLTGGPAAAGDRDRSHGVNIYVQRQDLPADDLDPARMLRASWKDLSQDDLLDRLRIHLRRGRHLRRPQIDAITAIDGGRPTLAIFGPGRGRMSVLEHAASLRVIRGGGPVVIALPLQGQVERSHAAVAPRLARFGIRTAQAHGALLFRQRQRLLQMLAGGTADVIMATLEFLRHAPPTLRPSLVLLDGEPVTDANVFAEVLERLGQPAWSVSCAFAEGAEIAALRERGGLQLLGDTFLRTNLRLVDRRNPVDRLSILSGIARKEERVVVHAGSRREAVDTAAALREQGITAAYYHGGLPLRVREVLEQGLADRRVDVLVVADGLREESAPPDLRQVVIAGLPRDRAEFADWIGIAGLDGRQAVVTLLYGQDDLKTAEATLAEIHPGRDVLAAVFKAVREQAGRPGGASWPDEALAAALNGAIRSKRTIGIALDVLNEAAVLQREFDGERWRLTVPGESGRRDLSTSLRYTEGEREAAELSRLAGFAFGPLPQILRTAAGTGAVPSGKD
ncbi:MAG: single-stranded-DNA-specific exonuclease RecJ [bacterium]